MSDAGQQFFPQERELFEVYARYAASALDGATALLEANQRYGQSSALLELARALAAAGTSGEVARRLVDAVPGVVDCDRVGVYLWDGARGEIVRRATNDTEHGDENVERGWRPTPGGPLQRLLEDPAWNRSSSMQTAAIRCCESRSPRSERWHRSWFRSPLRAHSSDCWSSR